MTTLAYPSADFLELPSVALDLPGGRVAAHVADTVTAVRLTREVTL